LMCEICGRQIVGEPKKIMIERAKMLVCGECAKLGSTYTEPEAAGKSYSAAAGRPKSLPVFVSAERKSATTNLPEAFELVDEFASLVRENREKMGLSHKELGRKIGEKESVLKKIEARKMVPDKRLATKLEHTLKVKLLVQPEEPEVPATFSSIPSTGLTLGEVVHLKGGKRRNPEDEGDNSP